MASHVIREIKPTDFEDMAETFLSFFPEAEADPSFGLSLLRRVPTMDEEREWFSTHMRGIEEGNIVSRVAEVRSHVVAWCDVRRLTPGSPLDHRGTLGICVRKGFRGQGIGKSLLEEIIDACRGRFEAIELAVFSNNRSAIGLYEKFGFERVGRVPGAIKRGGKYFDEDLMRLEP